MSEESVLCPVCGKRVAQLRYCNNCGALLEGTKEEEVEETINRLTNLLTLFETFEQQTKEILSEKSKIRLEDITDEINKLVIDFKARKKSLQKTEYVEVAGEKIPLVFCPVCGSEVRQFRFCPECGNPLRDSSLEFIEKVLERLNFTATLIQAFKQKVSNNLSRESNRIIENIVLHINQLINRLYAKQKALKEVRVAQQPPISSQRVPIDSARVRPSPVQPLDVSPRPSEPTQESVRREGLWTRLEKNLLNYIFFYIAVIFLGVGITLFLYFIVVQVESEITQLIIIFSTGTGFILLGQIFSLVYKQSSQENEIATSPEQNATSSTEEKRVFPVPRFMTVIIFIGIIINFVGCFVGLSGYELLSVNKGLFLFMSWGFSLVAMALGIWNQSELLITEGFLSFIIFSTIDLLWGKYPATLNEITAFFAFLIPILIATLIGIFFQKWTGAIVSLAIIPILLFIPKINFQMGLEFLLIITLPLMALLIIRFQSEGLSLPLQRSLAGISIILPAISLLVMTIFSGMETSEPAWAQLYPFEILITCAALLTIIYYYSFIQEEYLELSFSTDFTQGLGQLVVGVVAIVTVALFPSILITSLFCLMFFILGTTSSLTPIQKEFSPLSSSLAYIFTEVLIIILLVLFKPTTLLEESFLFVLTIAFIIIAIVSLFIPKIFHESSLLFLVWTSFSGTNLLILGLLELVSAWFVFAAMCTIFLVTIIVNIPILTPKIESWRKYSISALIISAIITTVFLLTGHLDLFTWEPLIIYLVLVAICSSVFINWENKEETTIE
ncbi:MAG: hypothetical protein GF308_15895 [Candidatus Heimdallarchaeota archaeon]|nr:hypothetical protein [Candidatus Heimdallarchaeota archaeon]